MNKRIKICDICGTEKTESKYGEGFFGWGAIGGVNNDDNPTGTIDLCPEDLNKIVSLLENMKKEV